MRVDLAAGWQVGLFLAAKLVRIWLFYLILQQVMSKVDTLGGYSGPQVILIYFTFVLVNTLSQMLFRGVYHFRNIVLSGGLDGLMLRPVSLLFQSLMLYPDVYDLLTLVSVAWWSRQIIVSTPEWHWWAYWWMVLVGLVYLAAWNVLSLAWSLRTDEFSPIMIFRQVFKLGRHPLTVYPRGLQWGLTYLVPVWVSVMAPVAAAGGQLRLSTAIYLVGGGVVVWWLAVKIFYHSLQNYCSASS